MLRYVPAFIFVTALTFAVVGRLIFNINDSLFILIVIVALGAYFWGEVLRQKQHEDRVKRRYLTREEIERMLDDRR